MRLQTHRRWAGLCPIVLLLFSSCTHLFIAVDELDAIETQAVSPCSVVFLCQGMLKDFGIPWDHRLAEELAQEGNVGLVIKYFTGPTGVIFDYGSVAPGKLVAELADQITRLHDESECSVPLTLRAVGFSHGSEVLARAADYAQVARFDRMVFVNASLFSWSPTIAAEVRDGTIGAIRNYWSPFDFVTLLAPLGAGALGLHTGGDATDNRITFQPHLPLFMSGLREEVVDYVARERETASRSDEEFARALAQLLREHVDDE